MIVSRRLMLIGLAGLGLSACGRRGALEPPPGAQAAAPAVAEPGGIPVAGPLKGRKKRTPITPPKAPFILDPIL